MPRVRVEWIEGRTREQREEVARRITAALVDVADVKPEAVGIVFDEYPASHYFKAGVAFSRNRTDSGQGRGEIVSAHDEVDHAGAAGRGKGR